MRDPRLIRGHFELFGQRALILGRIDVRVRMIVEQAEEPVEPHIDRGRLHHFRGPRVKRDMAVAFGGENVAIRQQHNDSLRMRDVRFHVSVLQSTDACLFAYASHARWGGVYVWRGWVVGAAPYAAVRGSVGPAGRNRGSLRRMHTTAP